MKWPETVDAAPAGIKQGFSLKNRPTKWAAWPII